MFNHLEYQTDMASSSTKHTTGYMGAWIGQW